MAQSTEDTNNNNQLDPGEDINGNGQLDSGLNGRFLVTGMIRQTDIGTIWWQFPWRLITYGFCHDRSSLFHLAFNMICLWMFGRLIEGIYGRRYCLLVYLLGVFISGVCHLGWQLASGGDATPMVGASGGVMAFMVLAAIHFPRITVLLFLIIPV